MATSDRTIWAVSQMRRFQALEEQRRDSAEREYKAAKEGLVRAYARTGRESLGNLEKAIDRRALNDQTRKEIIGDEQFFRGLTEMYSGIALVELALDKLRDGNGQSRAQDARGADNHLRDVSASRTERAVG